MDTTMIVALAVAGVALFVAGIAVYIASAFRPMKEDIAPSNPGGCDKNGHVWRKRATMISGNEEVYYCAKNCGSSLRHRFR